MYTDHDTTNAAAVAALLPDDLVAADAGPARLLGTATWRAPLADPAAAEGLRPRAAKRKAGEDEDAAGEDEDADEDEDDDLDEDEDEDDEDEDDEDDEDDDDEDFGDE